ncbi:MAG: hypothetical protein STSR0003_19610 [Smithella sp.]|jgi:hypothetical protein
MMKFLKKMNLSGLSVAAGAFIMVQIYFLLCVSCPSCQENVREQSLKHKVRTLQYWGGDWKKKPLSERLAPAPADLIQKLRLDNQLDGFKEIPVPAAPSPEFFAAIKQVENSLPEKTALLAQNRIIGIFTVANLGGSGYAETVLDESGRERYALIVLDKDVLLKRKANDWATWKERSLFKPASEKQVELDVMIESEDTDNVQNSIEYILLHETGHALGKASCVHPSWTAKEIIPDGFARLSWNKKNHEIRSNFDEVFPARKFIKPYAFDHSTLTEDQIIDVYRMLNTTTNFPSIHAATDLWEDFAESFVTYIHVVREKKPYKISIKEKGMPDIVYTSCWNHDRCKDKRAFMDQWFADPMMNAPLSCR